MKVSAKEQQQKILAAHQAANYLMDHRYRHDPELFKAIQTINTALTNGLTFDDFGQSNNFKLTEIGYDIILSDIKDRVLQIGCQFFINTDDELSWLFKLYKESNDRPLIKKKKIFLHQAVNQKIISWKEIKRVKEKKLYQTVKYLVDNYRHSDPELFPKITIIKNALINGSEGENHVIKKEVLENLLLTVTNEIKKNALRIIQLSSSNLSDTEVEEQFIRLASEHCLISQQEKDRAYEFSLNQDEKRSYKKVNPVGNPFFLSQLREFGMENSFACLF